MKRTINNGNAYNNNKYIDKENDNRLEYVCLEE